ncbi:MAG: hypothetical protein OEY52_10335 [Gammaproteobacteria bacterium]|nr:hypothetical protein [Gammaproteobacteria bacterium]
MRCKYVLFIFLVVSITTQSVQAVTVIDTGEGGTGYAATGLGGIPNQSTAAEFTLDMAYIITDIEGWMRTFTGNQATIVIYSDAGEIPGIEIYSGTFDAYQTNYSWQGAHNLDWLLAAGTYWVSFEVREFDNLFAGLPVGIGGNGPPNPLGNEAYYTPSNGRWVELDNLDFAVRIQGIPVPEPMALTLMVIGLASLGFCRKG